MRLQLHMTLVTALVLWVGTSPAWAQNLLEGDLVSLRIIEWRGIEAEMLEWEALRGPYEVAQDGTIRLPFLGLTLAAGRDAAELEQEIAAALTERLALAEPPEARLTVESRRPITVGGLVRQPGALDFRVGLTVRHAIALSGGLLRPESEALALQAVTASAQIDLLTRREGDLTLKIARLQAELAGEDAPDFPSATLLGPDGESRIEAERSLLRLQTERLTRELRLVEGRIGLFTSEIAVLEQKTTSLDKQVALATADRDAVIVLSERGLAANARILESEQRLAAVESQMLDVATAALRARQALAVAESDRLRLVDGRRTEVALDLQTSGAELADVRGRLELQRAILSLSGPSASGLVPEAELVVLLVRSSADGAVEQRPVSLSEPLRPGDLVEILQSDPMPAQGG